MKKFRHFCEQDDPCWKGYQQIGTKKKNGKEVPNCVPEEVAANNIGSGNIASKDIMFKKKDRREKYDTDNMFRRANGLNALKKVIK